MSRIDAEIIRNVEQFVKVKVVTNGVTNSNRPEFTTVSRHYQASKLSVLPVKANKTPSVKWSAYQNRIMTESELEQHFTDYTYGIAIVCGEVSGHLLTFDFDNGDGLATKRFDAWSDAVREDKPHLYVLLVINTTPNGGYHARVCCTDPVGGNEKLAQSKEGLTLIETRGEGGYAVAPPTPGYELIQGSLTNLPTISADERSYLIATARQFDQSERKKAQPSAKWPKVRQDGEQKAGDLYNQTDEYRELLTRHKWTLEKAFGTQERWLRPGSDSESSATFFTDTRQFYVHSTNAGPLEASGSYDPFGLLVRLDFDGDHTAATRHLYQQHPEWTIPSNGYKPSQQEQAAGDTQFERLAGLHSETPTESEVPADSQDVSAVDADDTVADSKPVSELQRQVAMPSKGDHKNDGVQQTLQFDYSDEAQEIASASPQVSAQKAETALSTDEAGKMAQMRQAMQDTDRSVVELMPWTPGTGKTYVAQAVAVEMAERGQATVFAMQSNERAEQEAAAMLERFGSPAAVVKGRNADNCAKYDSAEALGKGGHSVRQSLCRHCPVRQECTERHYLSQFDDYQSGRKKIAFMPVESAVELLKDNKGAATLNADVLVFDEDPSRVAMQTHSLTVNQLDDIIATDNHVDAVMDLLSELILSVQRYGKVLNDWQRLKDRIQSILRRFKRKGGYHAELAMNTTEELKYAARQINDTSRNLIVTSPEAVARFAPRWLADIVREINTIISAESPINTSLVVTKERLVFRHRRLIRPQAKMVVLDAYGRSELYQQVFNRTVRLNQHQVEPKMKVLHVKMNTSRTSMRNESRWTPTKWQQVTRNLTSLFEFERMVVFVDGLEMVKKAETALESLELSDKVTVDYLYRGRGTNKYQDYDALVILGSAWPRSDAMVSEARALYRTDKYISDKVENSNKRRYRDSRLQQFKESRQMDEIVQSVYRIRPATHQHELGKKVIICTNFEVEGLTDQTDVVRLNSMSIEAKIRRTKLADQVSEFIAKYGYMTLASGLSGTLAEIGCESQSGRRFLEVAYNNIEKSCLLSNREITSHSKGFSVSEKTTKKDLKKLVDGGLIDAHRVTIVLNGKTYPTVVYGSLDAFKADIEQAKTGEPAAKIGEVKTSTDFTSDSEQYEVEAVAADPEAELPSLDPDVIDVLERYRIPRDQWRKDTVGGLAVVTFASLIGQVDDEARGAVLQIPSPDIISTNSALRQVLVKRQSGLDMLDAQSKFNARRNMVY